MITLKDTLWEVKVDGMPENNQRFDHLGHVCSIQKQGVEYLTQERTPICQQNRGVGICEEFCASEPVGFRDAAEGEWFLKPGCGCIKKEAPVYSFQKQYEMKPLTVERFQQENAVVFYAEQEEVRGYAYRYEKRIALADGSIQITHHMENTGCRELKWQSYAHNFWKMGAECSENLELDCTGMQLEAIRLMSGTDVLKGEKSSMRVSGIPKDAPLYVTERKPGGKGYRYLLRNPENGACVQETGDFVPIKYKIWIDVNCICPEVFIEGSIQPGEVFVWNRYYELLG